MKNLPLSALRAFAAVYDTGGLRPAARLLEISHSAVSRHLRQLEAWLGAPLFEDREGSRALRFTAEGNALGRRTQAALEELANATAAVREGRRGNAVILSTSPSFAARWLLPRLPSLWELAPWVELSVLVDQRVTDLDSQGADLAVRMGRGPWEGIGAEPLMDEELYPVVSPAYWEAAGKPARTSDLACLTLLHDRDPNASWEAWRAIHGPADLNLRAGARYTSSDLVLRAAAQGAGVALARGRLAEEDIARGQLIRPFGNLMLEVRDAYWIMRVAGRPDRAAVTVVADWLHAEAAKGVNDT